MESITFCEKAFGLDFFKINKSQFKKPVEGNIH
jgi:hypothetical protein